MSGQWKVEMENLDSYWLKALLDDGWEPFAAVTIHDNPKVLVRKHFV